jgi:hypothetical protein
MDFVAIALFWALLGMGYVKGGRYLLNIFFSSMSFGAFAVIPTAMTGGLTFTATPIVALAMAARYLGNRNGLTFLLTSAASYRKLGVIAGFFIVAFVATYFSPRLFSGTIYIIPVRGLLDDPDLLRPTTQNISQIAYLGISVLTVFTFGEMLRDPRIRGHILPALMWGALTTIVTGFLDFASQYVPLSFALEPFRTATYALLTDVEVFGGKRVVGLMPEASAYGTVCIAFLSSLYFFRFYTKSPRTRRLPIGPVLILLLIFTWLSKSSSAYVGLLFIGLCAGAEWCWRASILERNPRRKRGLKLEFSVVGVSIVALTLVLLFIPSLLDPITALFDRMVLQKTESQSFEQRSSWTAISWAALQDTFGLGVGVGSTRASNGIVAMFSGTGYVGAFLYFAFVAQSFLRKAQTSDFLSQAALSGIRWTMLPVFLVNALIGTSADFGLFVAWLYGFAFALSARHQQRPHINNHSIITNRFTTSPLSGKGL